jgi:hypothetical protein
VKNLPDIVMSPEEKARLEAEKAEILRGLNTKATTHTTPTARARTVEEAELPPRQAVTVEEAARTEDEIQQRIRQLNAEIEELRREDIRRKQQAARDEVTAKHALGAEQAAAAEQALDAKLAAGRALAPTIIAETQQAAQQQQQLESAKSSVSVAAMNSALSRVTDQARQIRSAARLFLQEHSAVLEALAGQTWRTLPPTWPLQVRTKYERLVSRPAGEILEHLRLVVANGPGEFVHGTLIESADYAMSTGTLNGSLAMLVKLLGYSGDPEQVDRPKRQLAEILRLREELKEQGEANPVTPASIVIDLSAASTRQDTRESIRRTPRTPRPESADMSGGA